MIDLHHMADNGPVHIGETWHFQAWHRDSGVQSSNLTDAVSVVVR